VVIAAHGVAMFLLDAHPAPSPARIESSVEEAQRLAGLIVDHQDWGTPSPFS